MIESFAPNTMTNLTCVVCGTVVEAPTSAGTCPECNDPFATLEVNYDMERAARSLTRAALAKRPYGHWRYSELLPVDPDETAFSWPIGWTPVLDSPRLAAWAGVAKLRLKDDARNPTACFKDRASGVGVLHAIQRGAKRMACASTGNAATSLAGIAAIAGMPATIFVPERATDAKLTQLLAFGADVRRVLGTYAQAYDLCTAECDRNGWYNRNCAVNPYLVEGKKTCGLEIAEQTASDLPDWVAVSVGDGCTVAGIAKGLSQMHELGLIERLPRVLGVQGSRMDPLALAYETGTLDDSYTGHTMADSIDVPVPRNWRKAVLHMKKVNGAFVRVTDDEMGQAIVTTGSLAGVFAEPAAAASVAGVRRAVAEGVIEPGASVLAVITGSGLKDIVSARKVVGEPVEVEPLSG